MSVTAAVPSGTPSRSEADRPSSNMFSPRSAAAMALSSFSQQSSSSAGSDNDESSDKSVTEVSPPKEVPSSSDKLSTGEKATSGRTSPLARTKASAEKPTPKVSLPVVPATLPRRHSLEANPMHPSPHGCYYPPPPMHYHPKMMHPMGIPPPHSHVWSTPHVMPPRRGSDSSSAMMPPHYAAWDPSVSNRFGSMEGTDCELDVQTLTPFFTCEQNSTLSCP